MHCKTSLVPTAVLDSYALFVCCLHRRPGFACIAEHRWYPQLSYIHTCCSYAVNIVDLRSHALQSFVGTHCCPTFVLAVRMPSIPLTCICTRCRSSLVHSAVVHSYTLHICHHYCWLPTYVLLVCRQHRRPAFVRVAEPRWYTPLSYIRTRCTSATITTGYLHTCCSSAVYIVDLRSYALQKQVGTHCSPTFVRTARMQSTPLTCIRTRCRTSMMHTTVVHSYTLHVCHHYRWLPMYVLLVCCLHCRPAFVRVAEARWYPLLSYIRTHYSYAVNTADLRSYAL